MHEQGNIWWAPPKKFSTDSGERKISWLELFYDLVYVIVISRTTQLFVQHSTLDGVINYMYFFAMIFWSWYNGSQYHDLHGSPGIRTRFMTLWQMVAVAALAVTLNSPPDVFVFRATISIAVLQVFITYLWWSVGIYDKEHRRFNKPYTICYLIALALIIATLYIPSPYKGMMFWVTLVLNYLPPLIARGRLRAIGITFSLSSSMVERLGLLVIIVFGEAILGVINGMGMYTEMNATSWSCLVLGIIITFALWWIFFSLIADRNSKPGYLPGYIMSVFYIPTIASLGMAGACFPGLMKDLQPATAQSAVLPHMLFGVSLSVFLVCICLISRFLVYPEQYSRAKYILQRLLLTVAAAIATFTLLLPQLSLLPYLICIFLMLLTIIIITTMGWFRVQLRKMSEL